MSRQTFVECLEGLYPGRSAEISPVLEKLLEDFRRRSRFDPPRSARFSQKDALLIAYPDMLHGELSSPLELLAEFADKRVHGLFSHLHVLPFFPSSSDEGFSIQDYGAVESRFGTWDDLKRLANAHALVVDLVLNHASAQGLWFEEFLSGVSPYDRFFVTRPRDYDASQVFRARAHPLLTPRTKADGSPVWVWTTFSPDQVDLDFSEPFVLLKIIEIALLYVEKGARILRLDAIAFAWKRDGTNCLDLPEVHLLVRLLRAVLDEIAPGSTLLSETNLPEAVGDSYFGAGDEAQLVYRFALPPLVLHAFLSGRSDALKAWAAKLPPPVKGQTHVNFLSSHDGIGLTPARDILSRQEFDFLVEESRRRGSLVSERSTPEGLRPYELNTTFLDAIAEPTASESDRIRAFLSAHAIMMALAGIPAVWFHSLVGSRNWVPGELLTGSKRSIHRERLDATTLDRDLDDPASMRNRIFRGIEALLKARGARPAFDPASPQKVLPGGSTSLFPLLRGRGEAATLTIVNVSNCDSLFVLPEFFTPRGAFFDPTLPEPATLPVIEKEELTVPARGVVWVDGTWKGD